MTHFSTPAIILRRRDYSDYDLILTVLTQHYGKCTLIAKAAKKSAKRFPGILEPFAGLNIVYRQSPGKGMPVLEEADLVHSHTDIGSNIKKTAYASYWVELIALWLEDAQVHPDIYALLVYVLDELTKQETSEALLNVLFQIRFVGQEGFDPVLERCTCCQTRVDQIAQQHFCIDLNQGGIVCRSCPTGSSDPLRISKGTIKQLQWLTEGELAVAKRIRFSAQGIDEATRFLEAFVPYHIGKTPKSLSFLREMRRQV